MTHHEKYELEVSFTLHKVTHWYISAIMKLVKHYNYYTMGRGLYKRACTKGHVSWSGKVRSQYPQEVIEVRPQGHLLLRKSEIFKVFSTSQ